MVSFQGERNGALLGEPGVVLKKALDTPNIVREKGWTYSLGAVSEAPRSEDLRPCDAMCERFRYSDSKEGACREPMGIVLRGSG